MRRRALKRMFKRMRETKNHAAFRDGHKTGSRKLRRRGRALRRLRRRSRDWKWIKILLDTPEDQRGKVLADLRATAQAENNRMQKLLSGTLRLKQYLASEQGLSWCEDTVSLLAGVVGTWGEHATAKRA